VLPGANAFQCDDVEDRLTAVAVSEPLNWFRKAEDTTLLGAGFGISASHRLPVCGRGHRGAGRRSGPTCTRRCGVSEEGWAYVILDGKLHDCDRVAEDTTTAKAKRSSPGIPASTATSARTSKRWAWVRRQVVSCSRPGRTGRSTVASGPERSAAGFCRRGSCTWPTTTGPHPGWVRACRSGRSRSRCHRAGRSRSRVSRPVARRVTTSDVMASLAPGRPSSRLTNDCSGVNRRHTPGGGPGSPTWRRLGRR